MFHNTMAQANRTKCGVLQMGNRKIFTYEGINLVGRNKEAVVVLKDRVASIHHAIITVIKDCHYIADVNSTNGTKLNKAVMIPFEMYQIDDGSDIEFTPQLIGKYKKLNTNASQLLMTTQNESQMTQVAEGLFDASTQVENSKAMFNDDLDDDLSKMVINTQFINDLITSRDEQRRLSEQVVMKASAAENIVDIHEAETQVLVTVPSINEAATQMVEHTSIAHAFAHSQLYSGSTQHVEVVAESQPLNGLPNEDNLLNEDNDLSTVKIATQSSIGNTENNRNFTPLNDAVIDLEEECQQEAAENTTVVIGTGANTDIEEEHRHETAECATILNAIDVVTDMVEEPQQEPNATGEGDGSDTDVDEDAIHRVVHIADLSTLTVGPDTESQHAKSAGSQSSLNLRLSMTQDLHNDNDSNNSEDMLANVNVSALKRMCELVQGPQATSAQVEDKNERDLPESSDSAGKKRTSQMTKRESADIISDSEDEDLSNWKPFKSSPHPSNSSNSSKLGRSRFILSDSESDGEEQKATKIAKPCLPSAVPNDSISDYDDSFVQRKSIANDSVDCIPATQDVPVGKVNVSYVADLSNIPEVTEFIGVSAIQSIESVAERSVANENDENDDVASGDETQVLEHCNVKATDDTDVADSYDFLAPTQSVCRKQSQAGDQCSSKGSIGMNSSDYIPDTQDVCDYEAATQKLTHVTHDDDMDATTQAVVSKQSQHDDTDVDFFLPTQRIIASTSKAASSDPDSELFCMPTQGVSEFAKSRKESQGRSAGRSDAQPGDFDFYAPTQKMCGDGEAHGVDVVEEDVFAAATQRFDAPNCLDDENDDFDAPTQPLVRDNEKEKRRVSFHPSVTQLANGKSPKHSVLPEVEESVESKEKEQTEVVDFDLPAQPAKISVGENIKDVNIESPLQAMKENKKQEVESQLEVMFQSQNVSLSTPDDSRPTNPLANLLETCSTQDVISNLTGTKRLSDDFEEDGVAKRQKITPKAKTTRKSRKVETPKPQPKPRSSANMAVNKVEVNNDPSTSKIKTTLDGEEKPNTTEVDVKVSSKLSMIKKQAKALDQSDHLNEPEIECLADTIPIKPMEVLSDDVTEIKETSSADQTLDTTAARRMKRRLMDEETMCSLPSPDTPVVRLPRMTLCNQVTEKNGTVEIENNTPKKKKSTASKKKSETKTSAPKRQTRQTRGSVASKAQSSDSEDEPEVKTKKSAASTKITGGRTSSRARKNVDYNETGKKGTTRGRKDVSPDNSDTDNDERLFISVPEKQVKLVLTDKEDLQKGRANTSKDTSTVIEAPAETKLSARRTRKPKAKPLVEQIPALQQTLQTQLPTPERNKRTPKPRVIFTMLDDPHLNQIIRSLGGTVVDKLQSSTVLVTKKIQRTLKLLAAIGNSIPICSPEWLLESKKAHAFLDPWDHLIKDPEAEAQWNFRIGTTLAKSKNGKIFAGYHFLLMITVSTDVIKGAIEANGGKAVSRKPSSGNFVVVATASQKKKYETFLQSKVKVVSSEAILVGILRHELAFDEFALS